MCTRPIYIYNPSRKYNFDAPLRIKVPCGHCEECLRVKRNEWFFRALVEYNYFKKIGGASYFITLSYDSDNIPHLTLPDGTVISAFSRTDIRMFCKYLSIWLKRHGYPYKGLKFLICSEYGGHSTKRPHYHGILYLPFRLDYFTDKIPLKDRFYVDFKGCKRLKHPFYHFIGSVWKKGFVICSKLGWEITSPSGIRYASKYITKDIAYEKQSGLRKFLHNPDYVDWCKDNVDNFPKHWQSLGFGESFCSEILSQKNIPEFLLSCRASVVGLDRSMSLPRYYHYKIEKKVNKEYSKLLDKVVLEPTDIGLKVKEMRLEQSILKDCANLSLLTPDYIRSRFVTSSVFAVEFEKLHDFSPELFERFCAAVHIDSTEYFDSVQIQFEELKNRVCFLLPQYLSRVDTFHLSLYRLFIRYMPLNSDECPEHKFSEVSDIISNMVMNNVYPPEYKGVIVPDGIFEFGSPLADLPYLKNVRCCYQDRYFHVYEETCRLLEIFDFFVGLHCDSLSRDLSQKNEYIRYIEGSRPLVYKSLN